MTSVESKVKGIVIPSGTPEWNMERMKTAILINLGRGLWVPYILSGMGRDTDEALRRYRREHRYKEELEFHRNMWNYMTWKTRNLYGKTKMGMLGIDMNAVDSEGNILHSFPYDPSQGIEVSGRYIVVSHPIHLRRIKKDVERLKKEGKLSPNLELEYVPTRRFSTPKQMFHEAVRTVLGPLRKPIRKLLFNR